MSELLLVRHAQASYGTENYDRLSELGHQQAQWLGEYFGGRGFSFDRIVCGRMVRHRETAAGIFQGMGREPDRVESDSSWNEFDFETLTRAYLDQYPDTAPPPGAPVQSFTRLLRESIEAWAEDRISGPLPERWADFEDRVRQGLRTLAAEPGEQQRILVVSSGGAISMALRQVLQAPASAMVQMNLQLRNSSVSHLYFNAHSMHFAGFNHTPHLDDPARVGSVTYY
jgi:broad specificity phosphatase PhoE